MEEALEVLKKYFGYNSFRKGQDQVIQALTRQRDVEAVMPTGAGKSICYQIPALLFDGISIVVSPLISLMKDQVRALNNNGIEAAYINSSLSFEQQKAVFQKMRQEKYKLIYVSPERLVLPSFIQTCRNLNISMIAVDEAHCISSWGNDFRPEYMKIVQFIQAMPKRPVVAAFTATATAIVKEDIKNALQLVNPFEITTGFDRPNLYFGVKQVKEKDKNQDILKYIQNHREESGIIYCSTRAAVDEVCQFLKDKGIKCGKYHAGMNDEKRKKMQEDFVSDELPVIACTNAFGMGIDKPNVSYVLHYNIPKSMEAYYQEAGRAGRDGSKAECILYYSKKDVRTQQFFIDNTEFDPSVGESLQKRILENEYERLKQMVFYATSQECLRHRILAYFGEKSLSSCSNCSSCLENYELKDQTVPAKMAISCIVKTGQRFGKGMIADILKGSKKANILSMHLDEQSTYGLLENRSRNEIWQILEDMEVQGYLLTTKGQYPVLKVTKKCMKVLKEDEKVMIKTLIPKEERPAAIAPAEKDGLFEELRSLRAKLAKKERLPAYMIFNNATLEAMAEINPQSLDEMAEVPGIGKAKLKKYGKAFLKAIQNYE